MTVDKQPRALYLADVLAAGFECDQEWYEIESARELRRLHAENEVIRHNSGRVARRLEQTSDALMEARAQRDELLEALQYLVVASGEQLTTAFEQAQEAIAKATGETK